MKRRNSKRIPRIPQLHNLPNPRNAREIKDNDDPKTSEWAYFKKLKTEARSIEPSIAKNTRNSSCSDDLRPLLFAKSVAPSKFGESPLPSYGNPSKFSEKNTKGPSTTLGDIRNVHISMGECKEFFGAERPSIAKRTRNSSFAKSVTPSNFDKYLSPSYVNPSKFSEKKPTGPSTTFEDICNVHISMGECSTTMRNGENQDKHVEFFSRKRHKLLHWIAETSFPEIDKCDAERYNLVSKLLSRLFPGGTEDTDFWTTKLGKVERNAKQFPAYQESDDAHFKKTQQMSTMSISGVESSSYLDYDLSWMDRPRDVLISNFDSAQYHDFRTLDGYLKEPDFEPRGRDTISCIERNCGSGFSVTKYAFPLLEFRRELDDYHNPMTLASRGNDRLLTLDFKPDCTNELSESSHSSVLCSHTTNAISCMPSRLASNQRHDYDIGSRIFEDKEDMGIDWNLHAHDMHRAFDISNYNDISSSHCYLSVGREKPCPLLLEKTYYSSVLCSRTPNIISFTPSHFASNQRHNYDIGSHVFEDKEDMGLDWNLRAYDMHRAIDISNCCEIPSPDFYLSEGREKAFPLLLEKTYWDGSEDDRCDDDDNEVKYVHWMLQ